VIGAAPAAAAAGGTAADEEDDDDDDDEEDDDDEAAFAGGGLLLATEMSSRSHSYWGSDATLSLMSSGFRVRRPLKLDILNASSPNFAKNNSVALAIRAVASLEMFFTSGSSFTMRFTRLTGITISVGPISSTASSPPICFVRDLAREWKGCGLEEVQGAKKKQEKTHKERTAGLVEQTTRKEYE